MPVLPASPAPWCLWDFSWCGALPSPCHAVSGAWICWCAPACRVVADRWSPGTLACSVAVTVRPICAPRQSHSRVGSGAARFALRRRGQFSAVGSIYIVRGCGRALAPCLHTVSFLLKGTCVYLKGGMTGRDTERASVCWLTPSVVTRARRLELRLRLPVGRGPRAWAVRCCLPGALAGAGLGVEGALIPDSHVGWECPKRRA